jgi:hypothetical protein
MIILKSENEGSVRVMAVRTAPHLENNYLCVFENKEKARDFLDARGVGYDDWEAVPFRIDNYSDNYQCAKQYKMAVINFVPGSGKLWVSSMDELVQHFASMN